MLNEEEKVDLLSWVLRSRYRNKILRVLSEEGREKVCTPSYIVKKADLKFQHASNSLILLDEKGLVNCLNRDQIKGRLYRITEKGLDVLKEINELGE